MVADESAPASRPDSHQPIMSSSYDHPGEGPRPVRQYGPNDNSRGNAVRGPVLIASRVPARSPLPRGGRSPELRAQILAEQAATQPEPPGGSDG